MLPPGDRSSAVRDGRRAPPAEGECGDGRLITSGAVRRLAETVWLVRKDGGFEKKSPAG
jgi:hypothetical protein